MSWIQTYTGKAFYPLDPNPDDICIEDIAHALSMICRYGGHSRRFYSVAEHSCLVSTAVPRQFALGALMHDSTEAYLGDMVRPIKRQMPEYRKAERRLEQAIAYKFGLAFPMAEVIKEADNRILVNERAVLMTDPPMPWNEDETLTRLPVQIRMLPPAFAEQWFLELFRTYTKE